MAIETPLYMQNETYSARADRTFVASLVGEGVVDPGGGALEVTERGAGANNSVDVAAGVACVTGDNQPAQGNYFINITATENVTLSAAPGSDSRIDVIVLRVRDPQAGGDAGDDAILEVVEGTAAASPTAPATPASAIALAEVLRTVGDTSVTDSMITDVRPTSDTQTFSVISELLVVDDATARDALTADEGSAVYQADVDEIFGYNGTSWFPLGFGRVVESDTTERSEGASTTADFYTTIATIPQNEPEAGSVYRIHASGIMQRASGQFDAKIRFGSTVTHDASCNPRASSPDLTWSFDAYVIFLTTSSQRVSATIRFGSNSDAGQVGWLHDANVAIDDDNFLTGENVATEDSTAGDIDFDLGGQFTSSHSLNNFQIDTSFVERLRPTS